MYLANCSAVNVVSTLALIAPSSRELYMSACSAVKVSFTAPSSRELYMTACSAVKVSFTAPSSRELYMTACSAVKVSFTAPSSAALIFSASSAVMFVGIPGSNFITLNLLKSTKLNESVALLPPATPVAFIRALLGTPPFSSSVTLSCVSYNKSVLNDIIILCTFSSWLNTILSAI